MIYYIITLQTNYLSIEQAKNYSQLPRPDDKVAPQLSGPQPQTGEHIDLVYVRYTIISYRNSI